MSGKFIGFIKEHPIGSALGAAALVGGFILLRGSGGTASGTDNTAYLQAEAASVQAGSQFQVAQLQANQAALQSNNQAAVANNQVTASEIIAQLQSTDTLAGISAQRDVQLNADTLSAQTTQAVSLLQAQVAENTTAANVAMTQINAQAYVDIASLPYDSVTPALIAQLNANTSNINTLSSTVDAQGHSIANVNNAVTSLTGLVSQGEIAANTQGQQIASLANQVNTLRVGTATGFSDLNAWSQRFQGGTIAPNLVLQ